MRTIYQKPLWITGSSSSSSSSISSGSDSDSSVVHMHKHRGENNISQVTLDHYCSVTTLRVVVVVVVLTMTGGTM